MRKSLRIVLLASVWIGHSWAQQSGDDVQRRTPMMRTEGVSSAANARFKSNHLIASALNRSVLVKPTNSIPGGDGGNAIVRGALRKQTLAAQSLLSSGTAARVDTSRSASTPQSGMLNGQARTALPSRGGPTVAASNSVQPQMLGRQTSNLSQLCSSGIATVDGLKTGVWFSPVGGPEGTFVIQGCGFGNTPGQIYLRGVRYSPSPSMASLREAMSTLTRDQVTFQIAAGSWNDRQVVAQIDSNAGGFLDTNNATLVVKTSSGQQYQAAGMNFVAAREDQLLPKLPTPTNCQPTDYSCVPLGVALVNVNAISEGSVRPEVESPSMALITPGETIAVAREVAAAQFPIPGNPGYSFAGGTDTYQFHFAPGFQLDPQNGVQLRHSNPDDSYCQTVGGVTSKSGNWGVTYTSTSSFQIAWETDDCWPASTKSSGRPLDILNYASVSAYALEIRVLGPRGANPWPSGNIGSLISAPQPSPVLLKP